MKETQSCIRSVCLAILLVTSTSCDSSTAPAPSPGAPSVGDSDGQPNPAAGYYPSQFTDEQGRTWVRTRMIQPQERRPRIKKDRALSSLPASGPDLSQMPLNDLVRHMRPVMLAGQAEYQLAWEDAERDVKAMLSPPGNKGQGERSLGVPDNDGIDLTSRAQVVGNDDRQNWNPFAGMYPYSTIATLEGFAGETGFKLINHHTMISTAHSFMEGGQWEDRPAIRFAAGAGTLKHLHPNCYNIAVPGCWKDGDKAWCDYAVVALRGRAGASCSFDDYNVGYLGWETMYCPSKGVHGFNAGALGYPVFPPHNWPYPTLTNSSSNDNYTTSQDACTFLYHQIDTTGGQSGGPIATGNVIGIIKGEYCDFRGCINVGIRMTSSLINWMSSYAGF
jgi:hypothetical protein